MHPSKPAARRRPALLSLVAGAALLSACTVVRQAPFRGASERVTDAPLTGPFDGRIVDATSGEPIADATVIAVWDYDRGEGFIGPAGSHVQRIETDPAGRYRIPSPPPRFRGTRVRLVSFSLSVYKRGYAAYRSDRLQDGRARHDFTVRHNEVALYKWSESESHASHLAFLAPSRSMAPAADWERDRANLDLYRELGGEMVAAAPTRPLAGGPGEDPQDPQDDPELGPANEGPMWLDATAMMSASDLQLRTGDEGAFAVGELGDLPHTEFYQGVHFQATDRGEEFDVAYRVWSNPPGGLDAVVTRFAATFPDVPVTDDVTAQTWVYDASDIRAVAFVDKTSNAGVLLTCGPSQCADIETAIILAKFLWKNLDRVRKVPVLEQESPTPAGDDAPPPSGEEESSE